MPAALPQPISYIVNVWSHRSSGNLCAELHDTLDEAYAEIAEGSGMFRYVESIARNRDGTATVASLYDAAIKWDHERTKAERDEAYRYECYTRQVKRTAP